MAELDRRSFMKGMLVAGSFALMGSTDCAGLFRNPPEDKSLEETLTGLRQYLSNYQCRIKPVSEPSSFGPPYVWMPAATFTARDISDKISSCDSAYLAKIEPIDSRNVIRTCKPLVDSFELYEKEWLRLAESIEERNNKKKEAAFAALDKAQRDIEVFKYILYGSLRPRK